MSTGDVEDHEEAPAVNGDDVPKITAGETEEESDSSAEVPPSNATGVRPLVTSDIALSLSDARLLTGRRGGRVVMLMGEVGSGKTTLLAELWGNLLSKGELGGYALAGSRTAIALEERAFNTRIDSGAAVAEMPRTQPEDDGFLHLRIRCTGGEQLVELLLADVTGEHFRQIREGVPLLQELPWAPRADRFLVLVDGDGISKNGTREIAINRATRQLHALRTSGAVAPTARVAVTLVKDDALTSDARDWYAPRRDQLLALAREVDPDAAELVVAAQPADQTDARGLDALIAWLSDADRVPELGTPPTTMPARQISRMS